MSGIIETSSDYDPGERGPLLPVRMRGLADGDSVYSSLSSVGPDSVFGDRTSNLRTCPSCKGLGRVPKDRESQLVALIPMKDRRLKPRRTLIYVGIAVAVCVIAASLLVFFLFPRDIVISSNSPYLQADYVYMNTTTDFGIFDIVNHYNVSNENFFTVTITGVYMRAQYGIAVIAEAWAYHQHNDSATVGPRSTLLLDVPMTFDLQGDYGRLVQHCVNKRKFIHELPIHFEVIVDYKFMGHSEEKTMETFQPVNCYPDASISSTTTGPTDTTSTSASQPEARK